ncbi:MAG: hypothetical protein ACKOJF_23415, partial [Planctomycetaceae bacterium]
ARATSVPQVARTQRSRDLLGFVVRYSRRPALKSCPRSGGRCPANTIHSGCLARFLPSCRIGPLQPGLSGRKEPE